MPTLKHLAILWSLLCCVEEASCVQYVTREEFEEYVTSQRVLHERQDHLIEDTAAKLACSDRNVQDFVRRCREAGARCDTSAITAVISKMRSYPHRMLRVPYSPSHEPPVFSDDIKASLVTLFTREHSTLPSTKLLLVGVSSHVLKSQPPPPPKPRTGRKPAQRQTEVRMEPDVSTDNVAVTLRNLRKTFVNAPYGLTEKIIQGMEPQIPSCETRSDELVRLFRELPTNKLTAEEQKIRGPWIDLILFMVDCQ